MAEANDAYGRLHQNLTDAGCGAQAIARCMELARPGDPRALLAALTRHRSGLLESVRTGQRQIDCLDYLIYQIQNGKTGGIFHEHAL